MTCDECNRAVDPEFAAPSCGAHLLHVECAHHFRCRWCSIEQGEVLVSWKTS
jgi:hypothetical protein